MPIPPKMPCPKFDVPTASFFRSSLKITYTNDIFAHHSWYFISALINGAYEKCCVLFNVGSLLSQIACSQNLSSDDGLKTAAKYFQQSSGIYSHLKEIAFPQISTLPTPDLSVDCLATLSAVMLAQAQDCFYQKASAGKEHLFSI